MIAKGLEFAGAILLFAVLVIVVARSVLGLVGLNNRRCVKCGHLLAVSQTGARYCSRWGCG